MYYFEPNNYTALHSNIQRVYPPPPTEIGLAESEREIATQASRPRQPAGRGEISHMRREFLRLVAAIAITIGTTAACVSVAHARPPICMWVGSPCGAEHMIDFACAPHSTTIVMFTYGRGVACRRCPVGLTVALLPVVCSPLATTATATVTRHAACTSASISSDIIAGRPRLRPWPQRCERT